jgi:Fic family protein
VPNLVDAYPRPFGRYERQLWQPDPGAHGGRRARRSFPFDAFIPATIADRAFALSAETAAAVQDATLQVTKLNRADAASVGLGALATQLLRSEALASSRIEGLELSHRRLARAGYDGIDRRAAEVVGNVQAMQEAIALAEAANPLTPDDLCRVHATLLASVYDGKVGGRIREKQNWIGTSATSPARADFIPPPPGCVPALVDDLCAFVERTDLPEVAQAAIAHAQFETIHPFADGNGRLGRCLIHFIVRRHDIAPVWVPPISLVLARRRDDYVAGLIAYRAGDVDDWILAFANAMYDAAAAAEGFARRVRTAQAEWLERAGRPRAGSAARIIVERLPDHPVLDSKAVQGLADCSDVAALRALDRLERADVLSKVRDFRRNRAWECKELFALLDDFEDQPTEDIEEATSPAA